MVNPSQILTSLRYPRLRLSSKLVARFGGVCEPDAQRFCLRVPGSERGSSSRHPDKKRVLCLFRVPYIKPKPRKYLVLSGVSGAATQIRTGDLILTKDVLYQLSHSSISSDISAEQWYYSKAEGGLSIAFSKIFLPSENPVGFHL